MDNTPVRPLPELIRRVGITSWSLLGLLLVVSAVLWIISKLGILLPPVVLSVALIYLMNPVVTRLHRLGLHRLLGSCLSYVILAGIIVAVGFLVVPSISRQASEFGDSFAEIYDDSTAEVERLVSSIGIDVAIPDYAEIESFVTNRDTQTEFLSAFWERIGDLTLTLLEVVLVFLLAPVIALYALMDLPKLRDQAVSLVPPKYKAEVIHVTRQLGHAVGGFLRGQMLVALIVGTLSSVGFWAIGLPFWLLIGLIAGLLNIVPFVGPWVGGALGVTVGLFTGDPTVALWALVVAVAVQQIDNHFVSPVVLRATVQLHPAIIILALLAAGALAGLWGVLLAVPLVASVKIVIGHFWRTRVLGQSWQEATDAMIVDTSADTDPLVNRIRRSIDREANAVVAAEGSPGIIATEDAVDQEASGPDGAPGESEQ